MTQKIIFAINVLLLSIVGMTTAQAQSNSNNLAAIQAGKQYIELKTFPSPEKEVIEFFSFNCPSCFRFEEELNASKIIAERLPEGVTFKRYHLDDFGPLAPELSQAWAVANVLGIQDKIADAIYNAIHKKNSIKTNDDIKAVFNQFGIDSVTYDKTKEGFLVKAFMSQQKEAIKEVQPDAIPTVVVNRKYAISANGLDGTSNQSFINDYARVAAFLSQLAPNKK